MPSNHRHDPVLRPPQPSTRHRRGARLLLAFVSLLALLLAACATTGTPSNAGTLRVTIRGLPAGVDADVTVTGRNSFNRDLTASANLPGLPPGNYTVTAADVSDGGDTYSATVDSSPARVTTGETTIVTVTYQTGVGSLQVDISGLPGGTDADVTVTGPGGFSQALTAGDTLTGLEPGDYEVTAAAIPGDSAYQATVTPATVTVAANATATSSVVYELVLGTLDLTVSGLPGGADADIVVTGPGGYSASVTANETLADLTPGDYTVTSSGVAVGTYAAALYDPTTTTQTVSVVSDIAANTQASAGVAYELVEPSGRLWLGVKAAGAIDGWADDQLAADSTGLAPEVAIGGDGDRENGIAFDGDGNLWISDTDDNEIRVYDAADLTASGTPAARATITSGDLVDPIGIAFDADGNLWVANYSASAGFPGNGTVVRFDEADIAGLTGGSLVAAGAVITSTDPNGDTAGATGLADDSLVNPIGIAFDADGNLWVANQRNNSIVGYDAADLAAASGTASLAISARIDSTDVNIPGGIAFDADGNLWVSNQGSRDTIVRFDAANLPSGTALLAADGIIQAETTERNDPIGIAFDHSGNLWVAGHAGAIGSTDLDNLVRFENPGAIDTSGTAVEAATVQVSDIDGGFPTFFPTPEGLPIQTPVLTTP